MNFDNEPEEQLTVIDKDAGSVESGESLQIYMKTLQKMPLLKKEEEFRLAKQIRSSKATILTLCAEVPECVTEIFLLKGLSATDLRKLFFVMIDEDSDKDEVPRLLKKLETLLTNSLANKKGAKKKLIEFLQLMNFTLIDLKKLAKPVLEHGTAEQKRSLNKELHLFQTSKNKLIEGNLRLVFSRSKIYLNRGLSLEDLLQEGNIGLINAIEKYDVEKGYKFGTYATWWIDQALGRAVADKGRLIRVPVHMVENINKINKANRILSQKLGRDPSIQEVARVADISEDKIKKVKAVAIFPHSVEDLMGEHGVPLSEFLVDYHSPSPEDILERKEISERVALMLSKLSPREEKILRMRFGIGQKKPSILNTISLEVGVSRERIRQVINRSIEKLGTISNKELNSDWLNYIRSQKKTGSREEER